jgi:hypothetical protein
MLAAAGVGQHTEGDQWCAAHCQEHRFRSAETHVQTCFYLQALGLIEVCMFARNGQAKLLHWRWEGQVQSSR